MMDGCEQDRFGDYIDVLPSNYDNLFLEFFRDGDGLSPDAVFSGFLDNLTLMDRREIKERLGVPMSTSFVYSKFVKMLLREWSLDFFDFGDGRRELIRFMFDQGILREEDVSFGSRVSLKLSGYKRLFGGVEGCSTKEDFLYVPLNRGVISKDDYVRYDSNRNIRLYRSFFKKIIYSRRSGGRFSVAKKLEDWLDDFER